MGGVGYCGGASGNWEMPAQGARTLESVESMESMEKCHIKLDAMKTMICQ